MFLFPAAYPQSQHRPTSVYDSGYSYLDRHYLHALAQQRAQERREAQYRAHLEAARRQRAYQEQLARQEAARRRNELFFGGYDDEPYYNLLRRTRSREDHEIPAEQASENLMHQSRTSIPISGPQEPTPNTEPQLKADIIPPQPSDPEVRDAAARKIQTFARTILPRLRALRAIAAISHKFAHLQENFRFPAVIDFDDTTATSSLLFTPRNAPLHGHEHALVKLLSSLDAVESNGDARVRAARKDLVKRIEGALAELDARKETMWRGLVAKASDISATSPDEKLLELDPTTARESDEGGMDLDTSSLDLCEEEELVDKEISVISEDEDEVLVGDTVQP